MKNPLYQLWVAYLEWKGRRKDLVGQEQRYLYRWVARTYPDLVCQFSIPVAFRQQCMELQRGGQPPASRGLSLAILERYADDLVAWYLRKQTPGQSFSHFLEQVQRTCPTEQALKAKLTAELVNRE